MSLASQYFTDGHYDEGMKDPSYDGHRMTHTPNCCCLLAWLVGDGIVMTRIWQYTYGNTGVPWEDCWWREDGIPQSGWVMMPARRKLVARRGYVFFVRRHWQLLGFPETKVLSRCCQSCLCVHHPQQLPSWIYIDIYIYRWLISIEYACSYMICSDAVKNHRY